MAESVLFATEPRQSRGSQEARRLRRKGLIPAVLYGHKEETVSVAINAAEFEYAIRHGSRVVDLKTAKGVEKALVKEIQWDHLGMHILHADFARVSEQDRVKVPVPLEIRGVAPGVTAGGLLDQPLHSLEVECQATNIPNSIRVNLNELQIGQAIHVRDLKLPEGVVALGDPDAIVVQITEKQVEPEAVTEPVADQAEPEIIGRQAKEEEEAEVTTMADDVPYKVVVGLGNPGPRYVGTRHNVGFDVVDHLARGPGAGRFQSRFQAQVAELREDPYKVFLVKPDTFMNLSGRAVRQVMDFYQVPPESLLVVCDDINLPLGKLRVRARGTHGGHNGLRDIQNHLGSTEYARLRVGVGSPPEAEAVDHVLGRFRPSERPVIEDAISRAVQAVVVWILQGVQTCMNRFNPDPKTEQD